MSVYLLLRFLHISASIIFIGGLFARQVARSLSNRVVEIATLVTRNRAAEKVESLMVIPGNLLTIVFGLFLAFIVRAPLLGSLAGSSRNWLAASIALLIVLLLLVPLVFLPRGRAFEAALQEAVHRNEITPEVRRHLEDPVVRRAHLAEMAGAVVIVALMVFKPF